MGLGLDRDAKKSKISERPAEFRVHSSDNSKNFLLKNFKKYYNMRMRISNLGSKVTLNFWLLVLGA